MHIAIPCGAGVDSTLLLVDVLRQTSHHVTAFHVRENFGDHFVNTGRIDRGVRAFDSVTEWCRENIRDFDTDIFDPCVDPEPEEMLAIRPGFAEQRRTAWIKQKWGSIGRIADHIKPDQVWCGHSAQNCRRSPEWRAITHDSYYSQTSVRLLSPFLVEWDVAEQFYILGRFLGLGRFSIYHRIPDGLKPLIASCIRLSSNPCGTCHMCITPVFYETVCRGMNTDQILEIDRCIEQAAQFGRWAEEADPVEYRHQKIYEILSDFGRWRSIAAQIQETAMPLTAQPTYNFDLAEGPPDV